jgi:hypothetical protein
VRRLVVALWRFYTFKDKVDSFKKQAERIFELQAELTQREMALTERHIQETNAEIRAAAQEIMMDARAHRIPIQVVAGTPEETADLRALLAEGHATVTVGATRRRKKVVVEEAPSPTAWERLLQTPDEDEEGALCPVTLETKTEVPPSPPRKSRKKKKT